MTLPPVVTTEWPLDKHGDPQRRVVVKQPSNAHPLAGLSYDPEVMSLRALMGAGVNLTEVSLDMTSNDPNVAALLAERSVMRIIDSFPVVTEQPSTEQPSTEQPSNE